MQRVTVVAAVVAAIVAGTAGAQTGGVRCCPRIESYPSAWSPDGERLFFVSNLPGVRVGKRTLDAYVARVDGGGIEPMRADHPDGRFIRTPDGRRVAFRTHAGDLFLVDQSGERRREIAKRVVDRSISVTRDGRRIAYAVAVGLKVAYVYVADVATGDTRRLATGFATALSPDGTRLAVEDDDEVTVLEVDSGRLLYSSLGCCYNPRLPLFSPDGRRVALSADDRNDRSHVYVVDLTSGRVRDVAIGGEVDSWSPDGSRLAFAKGESAATIRADGTGLRRLPDGLLRVRFSPDWKRYAFAVPVLAGTELYIKARGRRPHRVGPSQCAVLIDRCVAGTSVGEAIRGGARRDVVLAGFGNDRVSGRAGHDRLEGEFGDDAITGGSGRDVLVGGTGRDLLVARDGQTDTIRCGAGRDRVRADRTDRVAEDCEAVQREAD